MSAATKPAGFVLLWIRVVGRTARQDDTVDRPSVQAIELVALHRLLHADSDGSSCYPSQETLAQRAGVKRATVRAVDAWMLERGLIKHVRNRAAGLKEYRLTSPADGPRGDQLNTAQMVPEGTNWQMADGPPDGPLDGPSGDHNLRPPTKGRKEEEQTDTTDVVSPAPDWWIKRVIDGIVTATEVAIDVDDALRAELDQLHAADWHPTVIKHHAISIIGKSKSNPTSYLTGGLRRLRTGTQTLPVWCRFANTYDQIGSVTNMIEDLVGTEAGEAIEDLAGFNDLDNDVWPDDYDPRSDLDEADIVRSLPPAEQAQLAARAKQVLAKLQDHLHNIEGNDL